MTVVPRPRPPHLHQERTRHGKVVWFVRRGHGPRSRIKAPHGTPEFWREYEAALAARPVEEPRKRTKGHTIAWLIERYMHSGEWAALKPATRKQRSAVYTGVIEKIGQEPHDYMTAADIRTARDARRDRPHAANNFIKAVRGLYGWAVEAGYLTDNPTAGVKLMSATTEGFHTWTVEEVARFEARWPVGTRQRLALDVLVYTGLRRGDAVRLGRQHVRGDVLTIRTEKTGEEVTLPILPPLAVSIRETPTGDLAFIATERGTPFTKESFGNWFKKACEAAAVPGSAHGLRKAAAVRAAEAGATEAQLNAMFGWKDGSKESATYVRKANRAKLAKAASELIANALFPHPVSGAPAPLTKSKG